MAVQRNQIPSGGWVYVFWLRGTDYCKIGHAKRRRDGRDPVAIRCARFNRRFPMALRSLLNRREFRLNLIASIYVPGDVRAKEKNIHDFLAARRVEFTNPPRRKMPGGNTEFFALAPRQRSGLVE